MMLSDVKSLLVVATERLKRIENYYTNSLDMKVIPQILKIEIGELLNNTRTALEFSAYYIFETYCVQNYEHDKRQGKLDSVGFPIKQSKELFDKCINDAFKGLLINRPDIVDTLEECQPFNGDKWLSHLAYLNNKNKHKAFTPQERIESTQGFTVGTNQFFFTNGSPFKGGKTDLMIGNTEINFDRETLKPDNTHPDFRLIVWVDFIFKDLNISVIDTLKTILINTSDVINKLEKVINNPRVY